MMRKSFVAGLLWLSSLCLVSDALAVPTQVYFTAQVSSGSFLGDIGETVIGTFAFDPDVLVATGSSSFTVPAGSPTFINLASDTRTSYGAIVSFNVIDVSPGSPGLFPDRWTASSSYLGPSLPTIYTAGIILEDSTRTRITSSAFFVPANLEGFTSASVIIVLQAGGAPSTIATAAINQWAVFPVPEPGALALLAAGMLLGIRRVLAG